MRTIAAFLLIALSNVAVAGLIPETQRDSLIHSVLRSFWGHAKNSKGELIQPATEHERATMPVSPQISHRALDAGEISGLAEWCGLDWQPHYFALTKSARAFQFNDKQVAFVSFLHGAAQGAVSDAMRGKACGEKERSKAQTWLNESKERGLNGS